MPLIVRFRDKRISEDKVESRVFIAHDENKTFQLAGTLHLSIGEWQSIGCALLMGSKQMNLGYERLRIEFPDDEKVVEPQGEE